jgi:hypothetical protein
MTRYGTFFNANAWKNEPQWHFFNVFGPIQKSHILWTQMNEKSCAFNNGRQKNVLFLMVGQSIH